MTDILERRDSIGKNILPTGRKLGVVNIPGRASLKIKFIDGQGGTLPDKYSGEYTSANRATVDMKKYLTEFWDISDQAAKKVK